MANTIKESICDEGRREIAVINIGREYGSLGQYTLAELERRLLEEIAGSPAGLLLDLSETSHIGCGFLNVVLRCHARVKEAGVRLALCAPNSSTQCLLAVTRLDSSWEIFQTRRDAIETIQRPLTRECSSEMCRVQKSADGFPVST